MSVCESEQSQVWVYKEDDKEVCVGNSFLSLTMAGKSCSFDDGLQISIIVCLRFRYFPTKFNKPRLNVECKLNRGKEKQHRTRCSWLMEVIYFQG